MQAPTVMRYRHELRGWSKFWARLRRKPWAWEYIADVEFDPTPRPTADGTEVTFDFKITGPMRKEVVS